MIYRELGRTGYRVSQLGFGAMRLPMIGEGKDARIDRELAVPMLRAAFEGGVNYVDTAVDYQNEDSQYVVGEALDGWRDKIVISTKNPEYHDEKIWWLNLENSLKRLRVDSIDLYSYHALNWQRWTEWVEPRLAKLMLRAQDQGLVKRICCSFHDTNENLIRIMDAVNPAVITLQYNMLDRRLEEGIAEAHARGIGIVVMGPVAGGRLGVTSDVLLSLVPGVGRVPALALRFVLSNPHVCVALSGMGAMQMVKENVATASDPTPLSPDDCVAIDMQLRRLQGLADLYCTGCSYCMPCPQDVNIPHVFQKYNEARVYGLWEASREAYQTWHHVSGKPAEACVECGECENKCPQHIPIREQLEEAHKALIKG